VREEQEHGDHNYGHTGVKLHFGHFLQHIQNLFFRDSNAELGTGVQTPVVIVLQIPYFPFVNTHHCR
jgi:hypothetical protein